MPNTAVARRRSRIPWVLLILLPLTSINLLVHGEQVNDHDHHVHEDNDHHGEQAEHHRAAVTPDITDEHHDHAHAATSDELEASHVGEHDHSEHVHDEHCSHDHGNDHSATATKDSTEEQSPPAHDHSHSHSHDHSHRPRRPPPKLTPLMESIRDDDHDAFLRLLSDPTVDISHAQGDWPVSALLYTFALRKYSFTEELLRAGAKVDMRSENSEFEGVSPLKLALKTIKGDDETKFRLVRLLVEGGAEIEEDLEEDYRELMSRMEGKGVGGGEGEGEGDEKEEVDEDKEVVKDEL